MCYFYNINYKKIFKTASWEKFLFDQYWENKIEAAKAARVRYINSENIGYKKATKKLVKNW